MIATKRALEYGPKAPVPIFQHKAEFEALLDIYRERQPRSVLEIGTYHGGTLYHWLKNAAPGARVVSVDRYSENVDNRALYSQWANGDIDLHAIEGDSHAAQTVAQVYLLGPFEWIFIDAGHLYEDVVEDWRRYREMATAGGVVVFHDILDHPNHPEIEVERLWREIQRAGYMTTEIVADYRADWGGLGVVWL